MCVYNGARFLQEQLASIAAQTQLPFELIVCDDRSTDNSVAIARKFGASAPFPVRIHVNEHNLGLVRNFERAIGLCSGDIIALSDQDDVWTSEKIARMDVEFTSRPNAGLVFSDADLIDENSRLTGRTLWEDIGIQRRELERLEHAGDVRDLLPGSIVTGATMAFRTAFVKLALPIPENIALIHDSWLALIIGSVASIYSIGEPLVKYRQHPEQQVGARARKDPGRGVMHALDRRNPYGETLAIALGVRHRLWERRQEFEAVKVLADLDSRIAHLQARAGLPSGWFKRMQCVMNELLSLRYHRYSNGVYSALKDLLA